ncbi:MAG: YeeE/YedE family protein [Emcibacteraceae bacterium]|nr:YeeE/YedE family protein [Emcibacteraceae bacterium]
MPTKKRNFTEEFRRVAHLMKDNGLQARQKRRFNCTTDSQHNYPVYPFGSFVAAQLMGTFKLEWNISLKLILVSIIGGIMLVYGSRIAYGCNIGAFFSGISSASLGGWVWFVSAFAGNLLGSIIKKRLSL